jgi:shikimate dehydrogenase
MSEIARKRFGLLGQNISYSFSKGYFTDKFNNENFIGCTYENFDIQEIDSFTEILKNNADLKVECNDSYKQAVLLFYINYQKKALIGAVNTIKITKGKLKGYNTDYYGFKKALEPLLQHHKRP